MGISDHSLIRGVYKILVEKEKPVLKKVKNFKGINLAAVNKGLENAPWSVCSAFEDNDDHVWAWEKLYKDIVDKHIPTRQVKFRKRSLPWITRDIRKLMNQKYKALKKFRKTKETDDWNSYKTLRSRVRKEIRKAEANHWINCMSDAKDHKQFRKLYKDMTNMNKKPGIGALQVQDKVVHTDKEKAEALNEFFVSIGKDLQKNFSGKDTENDHSYINRVTPSIDRISLCLPNNIEMKCSRLNTNKACGTDNITTRELKLGQQSIRVSTSSIANKALETRTYPGKWKVSRVNAAFKKGISKCSCLI